MVKTQIYPIAKLVDMLGINPILIEKEHLSHIKN
jgi:hypothetical protein